jgi:hypothetical protein
VNELFEQARHAPTAGRPHAMDENPGETGTRPSQAVNEKPDQ